MTPEDVREHLMNALQADLVGPFLREGQPGAGEEVLPLPPSRWYLTGFLAPQLGHEVLAEISAAAGIRRIHNHMLRHTFASAAVMRGIPIRQVQEWLGHGSIVVTMRYAHLARGLGDELIRRLAPQRCRSAAHWPPAKFGPLRIPTPMPL